METDLIAYSDGEWKPFGEIGINPRDRGFEKADAVFDAARTFNGEPFLLREHVDRLYRSMRAVRLDCGLSPGEMERISREAVERNADALAELGDFQIWQCVTRGPGKWSHNAGPATVLVKVSQVGFRNFAAAYTEGLHGVVTRTQSYSPAALDPKIKHYSRMNMNLAEFEAADVDPAAWAILIDHTGAITEGTGSNVFCVQDGVLKTPSRESVLEGVSRRYVIDLAAELGIPCVETTVQPYDLANADEVFFTGTSPCIAPATRINRMPVGDGTVGPVATRLLAAWGEKVGVDIAAQAQKYAA